MVPPFSCVSCDGEVLRGVSRQTFPLPSVPGGGPRAGPGGGVQRCAVAGCLGVGVRWPGTCAICFDGETEAQKESALEWNQPRWPSGPRARGLFCPRGQDVSLQLRRF